MPESALSKEKILCQRCYKLMHYHQKMESHLTKDDFLHVLQTVGEKDCLVVYIVDLFDFTGSLVPGLMRHIDIMMYLYLRIREISYLSL